MFPDVGSRDAIPDVPGLAEATPMTHVETLELDRLPRHLIVLGGGYVGLELAQAFRRFASDVTVIEHSEQLANREDSDVAAAVKDLFVDEGIEVVLDATSRRVEGHSADRVRVYVHDSRCDRAIEGMDLLVAAGRRANTDGIGLDKLVFSSTSMVTSKLRSGWRPPRKTSGRWAIVRAVHNSPTSVSMITESCRRT